MSEPRDEQLASSEQMDELRNLAGPDEDIPDGMRAAEAAQRITELRSAQYGAMSRNASLVRCGQQDRPHRARR